MYLIRCRNYLKGDFAIDIITALPIEIIFYFVSRTVQTVSYFSIINLLFILRVKKILNYAKNIQHVSFKNKYTSIFN